MIIFSVLIWIAGLVSLVCWIMEVVTAFQKGDGPLLGILSIIFCGLGAFIIGWMKCNEWGLQKVMLIWTIAFVVTSLCQIVVWNTVVDAGL